MSTNFIFM